MGLKIGKWWKERFGRQQSEASPLASLPTAEGEIRPPWVEHPGIGPGEFYWREAGEPWKTYIWEPYYNALSPEQQAAYLKKWQIPDEWWQGYFDPEWREFWEHVDDPE